MEDRDSKAMRDILLDTPALMREATRLGQMVRITDPVSKIVIAGVGSSAIAGDFLATLFRYENVPIHVIKDYDLPRWVNSSTLVFVCSYNGDLPEATSLFAEAIRRDAQIVALTTGGKLKFVAQQSDYKVINIPRGLPDRLALHYLFFAMLNVLEASELIKPHIRDAEQIISNMDPMLYAKKAKTLAEKFKNTIPIIYAGPKQAASALRWKQMINENAKSHAFCNILPDASFNEFAGFDHLTGNFHVILLRDERDHRDIQKQFDAIKAHCKEREVHATEIALKGRSQMAKMFSALHLGDWVSYYMALYHDQDPTPTKSLDKFRSRYAAQ